MLMADFDQTLSKYYYPESMTLERNQFLGINEAPAEDVVQADASMKVMLECDRFTADQKKQVRDDFLKYWPVEQDPTIPLHLKSEKMLEWWVSNLKLFSSTDFNLTHADFQKMVFSSKLVLRHGFIQMVQKLQEGKIPLVVVSGGVKAIIDVALNHTLNEARRIGNGVNDEIGYKELLDYYNVTVLSNEFIFEEKEGFEETVVNGYNQSKILHSMNKKDFVNKIAIDDIRGKMRPNVILLGDIIEDCEMVDKEKHD
tara:strand:+ start:267 stop:1034 length:768 start_codon:yes stop_codon:yes gene_type:complete